MNFRYYLLITSVLASAPTLRAMEKETITFGIPHTPVAKTKSLDFQVPPTTNTNAARPQTTVQLNMESSIFAYQELVASLLASMPTLEVMFDSPAIQSTVSPISTVALPQNIQNTIRRLRMYPYRADVIAAQRMVRKDELAAQRDLIIAQRQTLKTLTEAREKVVVLVHEASPDVARSDIEPKRDPATLVEQPIDMSWQDLSPSSMLKFQESLDSKDTDGKE